MKFYLGTPIYYYLRGRKLFGHRIKYPLWRLAHVPEPMLSSHLYLDLDAPATKFKVPQEVPVVLAAAASSGEFTRIFQSAED